MFRNKSLPYILPVLFYTAFIACTGNASHPENISNKIFRVPGVSSDEAIKLDILGTAGSRIYLVWQERQKGIFFRSSADLGETWSKPFRLAGEANYSLDFGPRIFAWQDTLLVLWCHRGFNVRLSSDQGQSWSRAAFLTRQPLATYSVAGAGRSLFLAYTNQVGIFFTKSDNFGNTWQKPQSVWRFDENAAQHSPPYITIQKDRVYIIWGQLFHHYQSPTRISPEGKLFYVMSTNQGKHWGEVIEIDADRREYGTAYENNGGLYYPALVPAGSDLFLAYQEQELFGQWLKAGSSKPAPAERFAKNPFRNFKVHKSGDAIYLLYGDNRYQEKEWWADIPGHGMFTWDKNPYWVNNDLFLSIVQKGADRKEILLTPPLSYISGFRNVLAMEPMGKKLFLFWSGRKKVGKRLDQYGYPVEIFYTNIMI